MTEPIKMKAGDKRVLVNGKPLKVDFRIISEENYQKLKKAYAIYSTRMLIRG